MVARLAILCPGQGAQNPGMLELLKTDVTAWQVWQDLTNGQDCAAALQDDMARFLNRHAQPLIVSFGLAVWQGLAAHLPPHLSKPALVAGYSVGEMTAHGVAGALEAQALLALTRQRALLMDQAASSHACEQGLLAVSASAQLAVPWSALSAQAQAHQVHLAIDNGAHSCVLGGDKIRLAALAQVLAAQGVRTQTLAVGVAAHTPLLQGAGNAFASVLQQAPWQRPLCPVLAGIDASRILRPEAACQSLAQALSQPIRWLDCMDALVEAQVGVALELGPGAALARMLQAHAPRIACRSVADFRSLDAAVAWVQRQMDN
jgi:[acyl-carrier-protein] S-malonyltransferase